jgi:lipid-binding SYLF domain-containing protein
MLLMDKNRDFPDRKKTGGNMKRFFQCHNGLMVFLAAILAISGCTTAKGETREDKRQYVNDMREVVLQDLYELRPEAKSQVEEAAGYGVFSSINSHLMFIGSANGYGVIRDNSTKKDTYMKMFGLAGGIGLGIKDFRIVIIFKKAEDMARFIDGGLNFQGQVDAIAQSTDQGGSISGAQSVNLDIITYQLTETGVALQLTFQGTKFWKYEEVN